MKRIRRMSIARRMLLISLVSIFVVTVVAIGLSIPVNAIDGVWTSPVHTSCMCDSYDFWEMKDGVITSYSDRHESGILLGHYVKKTGGYFAIAITFNKDDPDSKLEFDVRPRAMHWFPPNGSARNMPHRFLLEGFYRPLFPARAEAVIANTKASLSLFKPK